MLTGAYTFVGVGLPGGLDSLPPPGEPLMLQRQASYGRAPQDPIQLGPPYVWLVRA